MTDDLRRRLDAVERAITEGDRAVADLADASEATERLDALERETDDLETRLADLEAAVRALRACVGRVESVDGSDTPSGSAAGTADGEPEGFAHDAREMRAQVDADGGSGHVQANGDESSSVESPDWEWEWTAEDANGETVDEREPESPDDGRTPRPEEGHQSDDGSDRPSKPEESQRYGRVSDRDEPAWHDSEPSERRIQAPEPDHAVDGGHKSETPPEPPSGDDWRPAGRPGERERPDQRAESDWRTGSRWPDEDRETGVDDRRPRADEDWPDGMDVDRAEPWAVPDPPTVTAPEGDDEDGLVDRLRDAL